MDPLIEQALNQSFARAMSDQNAILGQVGTLVASSNQYWADQNRASYARQSELIGATASQLLMGNKLANDILAQRAAGGQPQAAGGPKPTA